MLNLKKFTKNVQSEVALIQQYDIVNKITPKSKFICEFATKLIIFEQTKTKITHSNFCGKLSY